MDKCLTAELSFMSGLQDLMCSLAFLVHLSKPMGLRPWVLFICGPTFLNEHVQPSLCSVSGFSSSPPVAVPLFWQCSRTCGGGRQKRHISCPREGHCDWTQRPGAIASCSRQPCTLWVHQAWSPVGFHLFLFYFLGRVGRVWLYYPLVSEPQHLWQVQFLMHKSCKRKTSENITELFIASPRLFLQGIDIVQQLFVVVVFDVIETWDFFILSKNNRVLTLTFSHCMFVWASTVFPKAVWRITQSPPIASNSGKFQKEILNFGQYPLT